MKRSARKTATRSNVASRPLVQEALYWVICGSVLLIALTVSIQSRDPFRLPKDLVFRAEFCVIAALVVAGLLLRQIPLRTPNWKDTVVFMPLAIVTWTLVTTIASTNRVLSWSSFAYVAGTCLVFVTTTMVARSRELKMLKWVVWGGILNAALFLFQAFRIWDPFHFVPAGFADYSPEIVGNASTGFVGNANDIGSALLPVFVASIAAAVVVKRNRVFYALASAMIAAAVVKGVAFAALGSMVVAIAVILPLLNGKRALQIGGILAIVSVLVLPNVSQVRERTRQFRDAARQGQWDAATRGRLISFATAKEMIFDEPLTGIGPGTFGWQYYPYKLIAVSHHPALIESVERGGNFEEAHNDHLEVAAETGAPGYVLLLAALAFLALPSIRRKETDQATPERRLSKLTLPPLVMGFATLALAQYPLQLTSSVASLVFIAAICSASKYGQKSEDQPPAKANSGFRDASVPVRVLVILTSLVPLILIYQTCWRPWSCNLLSKQMEAALHVSRTGNEQARAFLFRNLDRAEACRECLPRDANLHLVAASIYGQMGEHEIEIDLYDHALEYERRPELYFNRAVAKLRTGDRQGALDDFVYAARFAPQLANQISDPQLRAWVTARARESLDQGVR